MGFRWYGSVMAILICGWAQAAPHHRVNLDAESGPARLVAGSGGARDLSGYAARPRPELMREGRDSTGRSENSGVRKDSLSFVVMSVADSGEYGITQLVSPVLNVPSPGGSEALLLQKDDPVPEPYGVILVPPLVARRRLA